MIVIGVSSCKIDEIDLYKAPSYIAFTNTEKDTMIVSFFMLGNLTEYDCPIVVRHIGIPSEQEKEFAVSVVSDSTSMKNGSYTLPASLKFQPMSKPDTFYIKLTNYAELQTSHARICIELKETNQLLLGDRNYRRIYIKVNDNVAKPNWWNTNVERYFLGTYSDTKFRLLMQVVKPDLSNTQDAWIRAWALELKNYLDANPTQDEDGSLMSVTVKI